MSQKKVDEYKSQKYNRAEAMQKKRRESLLRRTGVTVVALALVGWVAFSVFDNWQASRPREVVEVDFQAIENYVMDLNRGELDEEVEVNGGGE